jgi:hypothetical protein
MNIMELALFCKMFKALNGGSGGDTPDATEMKAGLYQTGAIALYEEQGAEAVEGMMITPWDELVQNGTIVVEDGVVSVGIVLPDNLPEKNEYGFYYGVKYGQDLGWVFYEDGSVEIYMGGELGQTMPAGSAVYSTNRIDGEFGTIQVSWDGECLVHANFGELLLSSKAQLAGDLIIPNNDSITIIGDSAFTDQQSLTGVVIPDSVTSIGEDAFNWCMGLTDIIIPNSVANIGGEAFYECYNLTNLTIGSGATNIGYAAFCYCENLASVELPDGLTSIATECFSSCANLASITIPNSVTSIGRQAFRHCTNLTSINFTGTLAQWNAINFDVYWDSDTGNYTVYCTDGTIAK